MSRFSPGIRDQLVELIDFTATAYEFACFEPDYDHFGRSLTPLLASTTDEHRDAVFCEGGRRFGEEQAKEKESLAYDDPSVLYWPRAQMQRSENGSHSKATMCRTHEFKYVRRLYETDELYDLKNDPGRAAQPYRRPRLRRCARRVARAPVDLVSDHLRCRAL